MKKLGNLNRLSLSRSIIFVYIVRRKITRFYLNHVMQTIQSFSFNLFNYRFYFQFYIVSYHPLLVFPSCFFLFSFFFFLFAMTHSHPIMMSHGSDLQPRIRFTVISFVYFEDFQLLLKVASRFIPQEFLVRIQAEVLTYLRITV